MPNITPNSVPSAPLDTLRPPNRACTCCAGPERRWFEPGNCALHPNPAEDDQEDTNGVPPEETQQQVDTSTAADRAFLQIVVARRAKAQERERAPPHTSRAEGVVRLDKCSHRAPTPHCRPAGIDPPIESALDEGPRPKCLCHPRPGVVAWVELGRAPGGAACGQYRLPSCGLALESNSRDPPGGPYGGP
jgi:hypothetical protein